MSDLKRYTPATITPKRGGAYGTMLEDSKGGYVRHKDYAAEIARLCGMVRDYLAEYDNPVPDLGLRRRLRDRLIEEVRGE